jgi:hypothetical protein
VAPCPERKPPPHPHHGCPPPPPGMLGLHSCAARIFAGVVRRIVRPEDDLLYILLYYWLPKVLSYCNDHKKRAQGAATTKARCRAGRLPGWLSLAARQRASAAAWT